VSLIKESWVEYFSITSVSLGIIIKLRQTIIILLLFEMPITCFKIKFKKKPGTIAKYNAILNNIGVNHLFHSNFQTKIAKRDPAFAYNFQCYGVCKTDKT